MIKVNEEYLSFRGKMPHIHMDTMHHVNSQQVLGMKSLLDKLSSKEKNNKQISFGPYCVVGFVLVSIKDVIKL